MKHNTTEILRPKITGLSAKILNESGALSRAGTLKSVRGYIQGQTPDHVFRNKHFVRHIDWVLQVLERGA